MNEESFAARNHCLKIDFDEKKKSLLYSVRSYIYEKFEIWDIWDVLPYRWSMYYYDYVKPFFSPRNKRIRRAVPRQYRDISSLIVDINFEFIKAFYEDEYKADIVDWNATEHHKEFAHWLELSYKWITQRRPQLEKDLENAYPPSKPFDEMFELKTDHNGKKVFEFKDDGVPYEVKYKEVNRIEETIKTKDTEILVDLIKKRDYFWT
jgi:hypothetical protein